MISFFALNSGEKQKKLFNKFVNFFIYTYNFYSKKKSKYLLNKKPENFEKEILERVKPKKFKKKNPIDARAIKLYVKKINR